MKLIETEPLLRTRGGDLVVVPQDAKTVELPLAAFWSGAEKAVVGPDIEVEPIVKLNRILEF